MFFHVGLITEGHGFIVALIERTINDNVTYLPHPCIIGIRFISILSTFGHSVYVPHISRRAVDVGDFHHYTFYAIHTAKVM